MALKQIKNKIIATRKTGKVTRAMESVSAVKMRKSQERAFRSRPYVHAALRILGHVARSEVVATHPLTRIRTAGRRLLVVVTSDKGLAGSVNSAVLRRADAVRADGVATDMIAVGRKAVDYARREGITLLAHYTNVGDDVTVDDVYDIATRVMDIFAADATYATVDVLYQNFLSTFVQEPTVRRLLPLDGAEVSRMMNGIRPRTGRFSDDTLAPETHIDHIVEPDAVTVLDTLLPQLIRIILFHALLEHKASEHSARMVAMKSATDRSRDVVRDLTIRYNTARQAAITAEVSEITAGAEAMRT